MLIGKKYSSTKHIPTKTRKDLVSVVLSIDANLSLWPTCVIHLQADEIKLIISCFPLKAVCEIRYYRKISTLVYDKWRVFLPTRLKCIQWARQIPSRSLTSNHRKIWMKSTENRMSKYQNFLGSIRYNRTYHKQYTS